MTWLAVLNMASVDLRFDGSDGLLPASDFGAVNDSTTVTQRGLLAGILVPIADDSDPEAAVAVARAVALNLGADPDVEVGLTLAQQVTVLLAEQGGIPARVTAAETAIDGLETADVALDTRLDTVEARPYLELDEDGTPVVVSQGA